MTNKYISALISIFIILNLSCIVSAHGTYYVNPGHDIQPAIDNATYGDTIFVNAGNYPESITVPSGIILKSNYAKVNDINIDGSDVTVQGFCADGINFIRPNLVDIDVRSCIIKNGGISLDSALNTNIRNNTIYNSNEGITVSDSNDVTILNNLIRNCNTGVAVYNSDGINLKGNYISNCVNGVNFNLDSSGSVIKNVIKLNSVGIGTTKSNSKYVKINGNYLNNKKNVYTYR